MFARLHIPLDAESVILVPQTMVESFGQLDRVWVVNDGQLSRRFVRLGEVFGDKVPPLSATKAMTGHALGAAGVNEAIYSLLMMENDFIAPSINIETLDEAANGMDVVTETRDAKLNTVMSNSFGFGGTNCTLVMQRYKG